jgi:opacity protein-like surface antigen
MKKILLSAASLIVMAGAAAAADMPLKAPILKAPPPMLRPWEGVYIGIEGGYGFSQQRWGQNATSCAPGLPAGCTTLLDSARNEVKGGLGGLAFGFNRQMGNVIWGLEFTWDGADLTGTRAHNNAAFSTTSRIDWLSTFTGRVGFLVSPQTLLYAKGGLGIEDERSRINGTVLGVPVTSSRADGTRLGFVLGAGLEYAISSSLSAKIEYNFMDFQHKDFDFRLSNGLLENWRNSQETHVFKAGINWRFSPLPVVARY